MTTSWSAIEQAIYDAPLIISMNIPDTITKIIAEDTFNWQWDKTMTFGMDLSDDNYTAAHTQAKNVRSPKGWQTTRGNMCLDDVNGYVYEWDIKAIDCNPDGDIIIGILCDDGKRFKKDKNYGHSGFVDKCESWSWHSRSWNGSNQDNQTGRTCHYNTSRDFGFSVVRDKRLDKSYGVGDLITVVYNSKLKTLGFKKNGANVLFIGKHKIIYADIKKGDIYPFVTVYSREAKVKLIGMRYYPQSAYFKMMK